MCPKFAPRLHSLRPANCTRAVWNWKNKSIGNFYRCNCHFKDSSEGAVFSFMEIVILFCTYILHVSYPSCIHSGWLTASSQIFEHISRQDCGGAAEKVARGGDQRDQLRGIRYSPGGIPLVPPEPYLTEPSSAPLQKSSGKKKYSWTKVNDVRRMLGLWEALATSSVVHHWISNH